MALTYLLLLVLSVKSYGARSTIKRFIPTKPHQTILFCTRMHIRSYYHYLTSTFSFILYAPCPRCPINNLQVFWTFKLLETPIPRQFVNKWCLNDSSTYIQSRDCISPLDLLYLCNSRCYCKKNPDLCIDSPNFIPKHCWKNITSKKPSVGKPQRK